MRRLVCTLVLFAAAPLPAADPVSVTKADGQVLEFKAGSAVVAKYHAGDKVAKPYLYPVLAPNGAPVTRGWPMVEGLPDETKDHVHQKSAWFCHGDVIPEGIELKTKSANKADHGVDFWSESKDKDGKARHGRIVCVKVGEPKQVSPSHVAVETKNEWWSPDAQNILNETRTLHLVALPEGRLFVFDIDLHASVCPITFGDTKEGSFGVRVNDTIRLAGKDSTGVVTPSSGSASKAPAKDNLPLWGQTADWNDYSGTIGGKAAGVAVFADPKNASPSAWHTRAYGLMAANPFGREHSFPSMKGKTDLVKIEKGGHLKLRFGIYAHDGDAASGKVAEAFAAFAKGN
jgi:hypothetical protein